MEPTVRYSTSHNSSTGQYSTAEYSTVQYSTVQYSTVQYSENSPVRSAECTTLNTPVLRTSDPSILEVTGPWETERSADYRVKIDR